MKDKLLYLQVDTVIQTLAIISVITSVVLVFQLNMAEDYFFFALFTLAGIQVLSNLFFGFKYNDKRRKRYLKTLVWVQGMGSLLGLLCLWIGSDFSDIALFFGFVVWIVVPFFMIFWSLYNSWRAVEDVKVEMKTAEDNLAE